MAEENQKPVNLGDLGTATSKDIRKALQGQPSPVEPDDATNPVTAASESSEPPEENTGSKPTTLNDFLGQEVNSLGKKKDGSYEFYNPYDSNLNVDLDQFETKRKRVSEDSILSGIVNGVEGLEEGFNYDGIEKTISRSQEAQGVVNKMKNGMTQLVADTGINVAQGFASLLYGVPSAIVNGDLTKLYDNSVANNLDKGSEFLDEFYEVKRGGNQSGGQKVANFLFDDITGAASFVMGAVATEIAFSAITAATLGGAAPAQAAATVGIVARGTRLVQKAMQGGKALMAGNLVDDALRASRALAGKATREGAASALQSAAAAARTPMAMQAAARVSRQLITGASMESGMEARHMLNSAVEDHKQQYEKLYGKDSFTEAMGQTFREDISGYADGVFGVNMALVGASNMLMFPKLFGVGLRKGMKTAKFIDTSKLTSKARARLAKNMGVLEGNLPRMVDAAKGNTMGRIIGRGGLTGRVTAANTKNALYEGFVEEGGQGAISRSTEDYISKRYDPKGLDDTVKFADSFLEGLKGSYTTKDGFKEIGIGMLLAFTGVPMYARNQDSQVAASADSSSENKDGDKPAKKFKWQMMGGYADQRRELMARDKKMDAISKLSDKHGDVGGILRAEISNMNRQNVLQKEQDVSIQEGRFKEAKDVEAEMLFSHAATKVVTGRYEQSLAEAQQIMDEMSDEELKEQLGPEAKNMTSEDLRNHRSKAMETYRARMDRARKAYDRAGEVYRGEDPDVHTGVAHMLYMVQEKDAREKSIAEEMAGAIEDMNEGQILDLVRAREDLKIPNTVLDALAKKYRQLQGIEKQLATKQRQGTIKNISEEKQKARQEEIESKQAQQEALQAEIDQMVRAIETQENPDRAKYDFSSEEFLQNLAFLHGQIQKQQNQGQGVRVADIQQLYEDIQAVSADRTAFINSYNDFIQPGGVARFEARMVGSIERLADMTPEERQAKKEQEAAIEEAEETNAELEVQNAPVQQSDDGDVAAPGFSNEPDDGGEGTYEPSVDAEPDTAAPSFGFPEPTPEVPNVTAVPGGVSLAENPPVAAATQTPTATPAPEPVSPPTRSSVGKVGLNFTNANNSREDNGGSIISDYLRPGLQRVIEGVPIGTALFIEEKSNGYEYSFEDGVVLATADKGEALSEEIKNLVQSSNVPVRVVTTSEVKRGLPGGEKVYEMQNGQLVSTNWSAAKGSILPQNKVSEVLPAGAKDIVGAMVMSRQQDMLIQVEGLPAGASPGQMEKFAGNAYVTTRDAKTGEEQWHTVQLETFGTERATQIVNLVDAYNQFAVNKSALTPEQNTLLKDFFDAAQIDPSKSLNDLTEEVRETLKRMIPSNHASAQKKRAKSRDNVNSLFAVEPIGKNQYGIRLERYRNGLKRLVSHDAEGNSFPSDMKSIGIELSNYRMNFSQRAVSIIPDGKGKFERVEARDVLEKYGLFTDRMPMVIDGKIYNSLYTGVEIGMDTLTPVPTGRLQTAEKVEAPSISADVYADIMDFDLGDMPEGLSLADPLPLSLSATSSDPMERAGALYSVKGLNSRQLKDGLNFSSGVMARAFSIHLGTEERNKAVAPSDLRDRVKAQLEGQLAMLKARKSNPFTDQQIAAHEAYLSDAVFNPLMDLAMVEMLQQLKGSVMVQGKGNLDEALKTIGETYHDQRDTLDGLQPAESPMAAFDENFAFGVDPKSTLGFEAKLLLMGLVDNSPATYRTVGLAGKRFMNVDDLTSKLNNVLAGVDPSYEAVTNRLTAYERTYPQFTAVLDVFTDTHALKSIPASMRAMANYEDIQKRALDMHDMMRNQFVVFAVKEESTFDSAKIIRAVAEQDFENGSPANIQIWNSNSRNMREHVASDMRSNLIQHGFFDLEGNPVKERFKEVYEKIVNVSALPTADQTKALAAVLDAELGIAVDPAALSSGNLSVDKKGRKVFKEFEKALAKPNREDGTFGRFRGALKALATKNLTVDAILSDTKGYGQDLINFFVGLADYRENFIQNSSKDGDNKVRHQYSAPKLLHQMLRDIESKSLQGSDSVLLGNRLSKLTPANLKKYFKLTYLSGIKIENQGKERDFHGMTTGDRVVAQLAFYGNKNEYAQLSGPNKVMISKFLMPTLADKQTMPILQAPALSHSDLGINLNPAVSQLSWNTLGIRNVVGDVQVAYDNTLRASVDVEAQRIINIKAGRTDGMTAAQRRAAAFVMMPSLNGIAKSFVDGKIKTKKEFLDKVHSQGLVAFEAAITADIQHILRETKGTLWEETSQEASQETAEETAEETVKESPKIGKINHFKASKLPYTFVKEHLGLRGSAANQGGMDKVAFVAFIAKYAIDSLNVRTSLVMDTMGDPGAFVKTNTETGEVRVEKTATNLGKRFAALIAPGSAIPYVKFQDRNKVQVDNSSVNFLVMPAREVKQAVHYDYLKKLGQSADELSMQENYDSADAAEYTTVEEHLGILYAQGKVTKQQLNDILSKIKNNKKLDDDGLALFQAMKPVTTARVGDHMLYVKSAAFPLVPQLTQGTELDKLRVFMEENNIQRAAYDSAVKLGNEWDDAKSELSTADQKMVPVHVGNTVEFDSDELNRRVIRNVDRRYMRIQQEVPASMTNEKVHGSQVAKLLLVDLHDADFMLRGEPIKGKDLYRAYMIARSSELDAQLDAFVERYDLRLEDGLIRSLGHTPESRKKFAERMLEEAVTRGYDANELAHLYFDETTGSFTTPLEAGPSQERIENLLKSIIFKEVYEPTIEGFSGPIRPEVGLKSIDDDLVNSGDIMWVMKGGVRLFDGNKLKVAQEGQLDQIIMPWKYKASLEKYMEDGNINADKLPPELLQTFAYRIPGQQKSSSAAFEIVGFLPATYADTLIVNEELVGRIGQDYDIDKMFGFLYSIEQADSGTISVIRGTENRVGAFAPNGLELELVGTEIRYKDTSNQAATMFRQEPEFIDEVLEYKSYATAKEATIAFNALYKSDSAQRRIAIARNEQVDIYIASMQGNNDQDVERAVHSPVTDGYVKALSEQLDQLVHSDAVLGMPMSVSYNSRKADAARSAKGTIGVMAQHDVLHAQMQQSLAYSGKDGLPFKKVVQILPEPGAKVVKGIGFGQTDIHDNTFLLNYKNTPVAGKRSEQFSRLLNHAVDNENNGLLDKLGITKDTWDIWTGLTHMGYNQETIGIFVAMPAVQKYLDLKSKSRRLGDTTSLHVTDLYPEYTEGLTEKDIEKRPELDKKSMLAVVNGSSEMSDKQKQLLNFKVLESVALLETLGKEIRTVQTTVKLDTNRPKTIVGAQATLHKIARSKSSNATRDSDVLDLTQAINHASFTVSGKITQAIEDTFNDLFALDSNLLDSAAIDSVVKALSQRDSTSSYDDLEETANTLVKGAKSIAYARFTNKVTGRTSQEIREEAHDIKTGGIATRLIAARTNPVVANNEFVKQLIAVDAPGDYPRIEFTGDRQLESSSIELHKGFLDLLRSRDPEVKEFGEYLVGYALATSGGRLKARGYLKYVPAEYLQSKGLGETVNADTISGILLSPTSFTEIIRHNADLVPRYKNLTEAKSQGGILTEKENKETILYLRKGTKSLGGHIKIGKNLYAGSGYFVPLGEGGVEAQPLKRVTELGDSRTDEYNSTAMPDLKGAIPKRVKGASISSAPESAVHEFDEVANYEPEFSGTVNTTDIPTGVSLGEKTSKTAINDAIVRSDNPNKMPMGIKEFLEGSTLRNNPFLQELEKTQALLDPKDRLTVVVADKLNTRGLYDPNTHTVTIRKDFVNDVRTVTHEMVHAFTSISIKISKGLVGISDPKQKAKIVAAVEAVNKLYKQINTPEAIAAMGLSFADHQRSLRGHRAFKKQRNNEALTAEEQADQDFFRKNLDNYYGFSSLEEFVAEAFSNKLFAERLSKIPQQGNKTFIDSLVEAINKALEALGIVGVSDTAFIREVFTTTMGLIDVTAKGSISKSGLKSSLPTGNSESQLSLFLPMESLLLPDEGGRGLEGLESVVLYKEQRIRQFKALKGRFSNNREFVRRVEGRLLQEEKELKVLTDDSVEVRADYLLAIGQRELEFARKTISNVDATDPQIDMALSALQNIKSTVDFYSNSRDMMPTPELRKIGDELAAAATTLNNDYLEKARAILREDAMRTLKGLGVDINADTFERLEQSGYFASRFLDASRQGRAELSYLDKITRDATQLQRVEFNKRAERFMKKSAAFKKTSYFGENGGWEGLVELDDKGQPTARLITMLNGDYDRAYAVKRAELGEFTPAFSKWKKSQTGRVDVAAMFDISGTEVKRKNNPKYIEYLNKTYGAAGAAEFLQQQETMLQEYMDLRVSEFDIMELTLGENAQTAKDLWEKKNSPAEAYKRAENKARYFKGATSRFLLDMPLRKVGEKATGYYDARFDKLQADPVALDFYNDYRAQMKEMMAKLPAHQMTQDTHLVRNGLFIPAISKALTVDLLKRGGAMDALKRLPDNVRAALTLSPEHDVNKLIDPITNRPQQLLPTYFMGEVDPETQDYDMDRTFLAFTMMATAYDSKNAVEDKVRMARSVMNETRMVPKGKMRSTSMLGKLGNKVFPGVSDSTARENIMKSVDTVVDTFYGHNSKVDPTMDAGRDLWTAKQKQVIAELEQDKAAATTQAEKDSIDEKIKDATPQVSLSKTIRGVQQWIQAKGMAYNVTAATVNMLFGALSVMKHASGQVDFNESDVRKATGLMLHSSLNNMTEAVGKVATGTALKIQNAMVMFDVLKDFTEMRYDVRKYVKQANQSGVNQAGRLGINKLRMYEIQRSSEYFVYGQGVLAVLINTKVEGKSLWEHMGQDGIIDLDGWRPGEVNHLALMSKLDQVNKRIHGNYDPASPIAIKKTLFGPLLMQFRSWLPEAVASRFEKEKYDPYLEREVKGTYITMFGSSATRSHLKAMLPMLLPSWVRTQGMNTMNDKISAVDQENIRKFAAGVRQQMQVFLLIAVLKALKDDEDDEESLKVLNFGLNVSDRVENDLALFGSPGAFIDMTQGDFLAAIGLASDVQNFGDAVVKTVQGDGMIETGTYAGTSRTWHHFQKIVPHLGAVQRMKNNLDRELGS